MMPHKTYVVGLTAKAEKVFKQLSRENQIRISKALLQLKTNPRPTGIKKMEGYTHIYRIRVGDWRVLYEFDLAVNRIDLLTVRHRSEVYR